MIVDSSVNVKLFFEEYNHGDSQENKPRARILAELLAAGYKIQDTIIEKGLEIDAKLGLTNRIQGYVEAAKAQAITAKDSAVAQAHVLDEKFKVTEKATEIDNKYHVQDRVNAAVEQGKDIGNQVNGHAIVVL